MFALRLLHRTQPGTQPWTQPGPQPGMKEGAMQTTTKLQVVAGRPVHPRRRASDFDIDKLVFWCSVAIFACAVAMV